jgi:hypothetical protein
MDGRARQPRRRRAEGFALKANMSKPISLTIFKKLGADVDLEMLRRGAVSAIIGGRLEKVGHVSEFAVKAGEVQVGIRLTHDETQRIVQSGGLSKTLYDRDCLYLADEADSLSKFSKLRELPPTNQPLQKRDPWAPMDAPVRKFLVVPRDDVAKLLAANNELLAANNALQVQVDGEGRLRKRVDECEMLMRKIYDAVTRIDGLDATLRRIEDNDLNSRQTAPRSTADDQTRERLNQSYIRRG